MPNSNVVPFPDAPCDVEREALEEHMDPTFIEYGSDIRIPVGRALKPDVLPKETKRRLTAVGILRASAALEDGPVQWIEDAQWAWKWFKRFLIMLGLFGVVVYGGAAAKWLGVL